MTDSENRMPMEKSTPTVIATILRAWPVPMDDVRIR